MEGTILSNGSNLGGTFISIKHMAFRYLHTNNNCKKNIFFKMLSKGDIAFLYLLVPVIMLTSLLSFSGEHLAAAERPEFYQGH